MNKKTPGQKKLTQGTTGRFIKVVLFLLPALVYLPTFGGNAAVPPGNSAYSDLLITHYPYLLYLRDSIISHQQIPLWSTLVQSGAPFAANPLAGVFYLPGWLAMLFPLPGGLGLNMAGHIVFGTWGMYRFLKQKEAGEVGSIIGALGFGLLPKLAAHFGAGHVTLIYAISWTPWLFYCSEKDGKGWKTGIIAGAIFLADPRWSIYAGLFWLAYDIAHRQLGYWRQYLYYLRAALIAVLISAPLLFSLLEYLKLATRTGLSSEDILYGSLPPANLIGVIIPGSGGNSEWYFYSGGILVGLFIAQLFIRDLRKTNRFWNAWVAISIVLSLGYWGAEIDWISRIPGLNMLRVPARSLFITGICFSIIAGNSFKRIFGKRGSNTNQNKVSFGIIVLGLMMLIGVLILTQAQTLMAIWGFSFFIVYGFLYLLKNRYPAMRYIEWIVIGLLVVDLLGAGLNSYEIQRKEIRNPSNSHAYMIEDDEIFRVYSPSYSVAQYLAAEYNLELVDGVDPMQIANYVKYVEGATGVDQKGYSVTIPAFATGDPSVDNIKAVPNSELLGLLNVKYLISEFEINAPGIRPLAIGDSTIIYLNDNVMPRAWVEKTTGNHSEPDRSGITNARVVDRTPNRIQIEATGPGLLVLSEIQYPGWRVFVDGERKELGTAHEILRSVVLSEGEHQIIFKFLPASVYIGSALAGLGWIVLVYLFIRDQFETVSD